MLKVKRNMQLSWFRNLKIFLDWEIENGRVSCRK